MSDYNPNSIWTSKEKRYGVPVPVPGASSSNLTKETKKISSGPKKSTGNGLWWSFAILGAFIAGAVFYYFFLRPMPGPNVSISFAKPDSVLVGDPFVFSVSFSNNSQVVLKNATLALTLPDGFSFVGQSSDQRVMQQSIGDLASGSVTKQDFSLIAINDPNSTGHITAKLVYATDATDKTQYESDSAADVVTGSPAINLSFNIPQGIFSGQNFNVGINYHNNTTHDIQNVVLNTQYPSAFAFGNSSAPANSASNNSWNLGTIAAGADGSTTISGVITGPANSSYPFVGSLSTDFSGVNYALNAQMANATVVASPLSLSVMLNGTSTSIVNAGDSLDYVLSYTNNASIAFQNVMIKAALVGNMYDFGTLQSDGSFSSVTDTVTWSPATNPELSSVAAGATGQVEVRLKALQSFPIKRISDKNFTLKVQAQIQSPTVPPNTSASSTIGLANVANAVGGEIAIAATGYRNDAASGITNTGPYPPVVNQPSQYTIHWDVTNYSTDVQNVTVSAYLQSGSVFTGQVKSNISTQPTYDAATGIVSWTIPSLAATTGVLGAPAEAVFQVENTPAVNQAGQVVTLLSQTSLSAADTFTSSTLHATAGPVTTYLQQDPTVANQSGQVAQ
jgi:uncharacterized repeat protein (TIGR01451 family)